MHTSRFFSKVSSSVSPVQVIAVSALLQSRLSEVSHFDNVSVYIMCVHHDLHVFFFMCMPDKVFISHE